MGWSRSARMPATLIVVAAAVGAVDAAMARTWDLVVLQGAVVVLAVSLVVGPAGGRVGATLRKDLAAWIERTAADGAERPGDVVDRAVAAYRDALTGDAAAADLSSRGRR